MALASVNGASSISTWRMLARDARDVIGAAREARKALVGVIETVELRKRSVLRVDAESGLETYDLEKLTDAERKDQFYRAMTWLNAVENEVRRTRGFLERAIERAERRIG